MLEVRDTNAGHIFGNPQVGEKMSTDSFGMFLCDIY